MKGHPVLHPLLHLKKPCCLPLTDTKSFAQSRMTCIQSQNLSLKPKEFKCLWYINLECKVRRKLFCMWLAICFGSTIMSSPSLIWFLLVYESIWRFYLHVRANLFRLFLARMILFCLGLFLNWYEPFSIDKAMHLKNDNCQFDLIISLLNLSQLPSPKHEHCQKHYDSNPSSFASESSIFE